MVRGLRRDPQTSELSPGVHFTLPPRMFISILVGREGIEPPSPPAFADGALPLSYLPMVGGARRDPGS